MHHQNEQKEVQTVPYWESNWRPAVLARIPEDVDAIRRSGSQTQFEISPLGVVRFVVVIQVEVEASERRVPQDSSVLGTFDRRMHVEHGSALCPESR